MPWDDLGWEPDPLPSATTHGNYQDMSYYDGPLPNSGFDWGSSITDWMKLAPNIIATARGNPQQYNPGTYGGAGSGLYAGGSVLGASGFGQISTTTLLLIGVGIFFLLKRR